MKDERKPFEIVFAVSGRVQKWIRYEYSFSCAKCEWEKIIKSEGMTRVKLASIRQLVDNWQTI